MKQASGGPLEGCDEGGGKNTTGIEVKSMGRVDTNVNDLVGMISRGELRLPEMQRRYVCAHHGSGIYLIRSIAAIPVVRFWFGKPTNRKQHATWPYRRNPAHSPATSCFWMDSSG